MSKKLCHCIWISVRSNCFPLYYHATWSSPFFQLKATVKSNFKTVRDSWTTYFLDKKIFWSMLTLVWIQMTVVPTSMYFFLGDFFIWNLLGWTAPTVCQESLVDLGAEFSLPFPICSEFFRWNPWVEIMLFGPFDEGGLPALVEVTDPLAYVINHIWSILQYMLRQLVWL